MGQPSTSWEHDVSDIFYDCEFVERGRDLPIQLVSIGLVRSDGEELYRINQECLSNVMRHPWLSINVVPQLPIRADNSMIFEWDKEHPEYPHVMALDQISADVYEFIAGPGQYDVELWADFGAYDHVVLCQLFGSMGELPTGIPMFTHEIRQLAEMYPDVALPPQPLVADHAMYDARWARDAYDRLITSRVAELSTMPRHLAVDAEVID